VCVIEFLTANKQNPKKRQNDKKNSSRKLEKGYEKNTTKTVYVSYTGIYLNDDIEI
jgi:hypothetical protein